MTLETDAVDDSRSSSQMTVETDRRCVGLDEPNGDGKVDGDGAAGWRKKAGDLRQELLVVADGDNMNVMYEPGTFSYTLKSTGQKVTANIGTQIGDVELKNIVFPTQTSTAEFSWKPLELTASSRFLVMPRSPDRQLQVVSRTKAHESGQKVDKVLYAEGSKKKYPTEMFVMSKLIREVNKLSYTGSDLYNRRSIWPMKLVIFKQKPSDDKEEVEIVDSLAEKKKRIGKGVAVYVARGSEHVVAGIIDAKGKLWLLKKPFGQNAIIDVTSKWWLRMEPFEKNAIKQARRE